MRLAKFVRTRTAISNPADYPSLPRRLAAKSLDQEVHHDAHFCADVAAARVDCEYVNLRRAILRQQVDQHAVTQVLTDQERRLHHHSATCESGRRNRMTVIGIPT